MRVLVFVFALSLSTVLLPAQSTDPQAIQRMAATERAFAAATAEIGVRDGFLTFFADDAIQLQAGVTGAQAVIGRAKDGLRTQPSPRLPLVGRLMWEPFTGHVSSDGALGWLTGAYVSLNQVTKDITSRGAYFSVWKRQTDGTWRVWLDEGVALPEVWQDATPFRAAPDPDTGAIGSPSESIADAERSVESGGAPWRDRLAADMRLHRDGRMPLVGRDQAVDWANGAWPAVRYTVIRTEVAGSGDLAITLGGYDAGAEHGTWVRAWKRDVTGRWRIVFETSKKS
jgi:ketosteroid isomerase-like protein